MTAHLLDGIKMAAEAICLVVTAYAVVRAASVAYFRTKYEHIMRLAGVKRGEG